MKPGIFIQSRVDSTRLPGKALLEIKGLPTLSHVIRNVKNSRCSTTVLTTDREVDDPIEAIAMSEHTKVYRHHGDEKNVLDRFYFGAKTPIIVRVTADCLGLESRSIIEAIDALIRQRADYAYAGREQGYPNGFGCEVFTRKALEEAKKYATTPYELEHVTPWMKEHCKWANWQVFRYDDFNMELNTPEDYQCIKNIYEYKDV